MKKGMLSFLALALAVCFCGAAFAAQPKIGIMTGTTSQGEEEYRAAQEMIKKYGADRIVHVTYPDKFMDEQETTIQQILSMAQDPDVKAIVLVQGVPGSAAAIDKVKEIRPDMFFINIVPHEDPMISASKADIVLETDNPARGVSIIELAKKMGAKTFIHYSFPRHMSYPLLAGRRDIMIEECKKQGLEFVFVNAPDPTGDAGIAGAQQFILEYVPRQVAKYGKETAFFCTNDAQTEPLLKRVAEMGRFFIESDLPSPLLGYPGALGVDLSAVQGDWPAILKRVEDAVVAKGGAGRMGTWAFSFAYTTGVAMGELGKKLVEEGKTPEDFKNGNIDIKKEVLEAYGKFSPGAAWNASFYTDASTGVTMKNYPLLYQDTYIFGKGYLSMTDEVVPDKYFTVTGQKQ